MATPDAAFAELAPSGYVFERVLAEGAFFRVIRITRDGGTFACRRLTPRSFAESIARAALAMEARVLAALAGRGAPMLEGSGEDAHGPFVVAAWSRGLVLREVDARETGASQRSIAAAFRALAEIHEANDREGPLAIVHGDVRPDNVLYDAEAQHAELVDFALASMRGAPRTEDGAFAGSLLYCAPEVARGEAHGQPADVFALAMSALESCSGVVPRVATSAPALLLEAARGDATPRGLREIDAAIARALAPCFDLDPKVRPPAREVAAALRLD